MYGDLWIDEWTDGQMNGHTEKDQRWMTDRDRQINRWMDGQRQIDTKMH